MSYRDEPTIVISAFFGLLAFVLVVAGVLCVAEARSYTSEQRARAPLLWAAYLACGPLLVVVGSGAIAWHLSGGSVWTLNGAVILVGSLPCFVQYLLHRKLGIERSPMGDRLAEKVARKLNFPEADRQA